MIRNKLQIIRFFDLRHRFYPGLSIKADNLFAYQRLLQAIPGAFLHRF